MMKLVRQPLVALMVTLLLPRMTESCVRCFHPGSIPHQHKHHQGQAIAATATRGFHPYGNDMRTNSIAMATTAARQVLQVCQQKLQMLQKSICTLPVHHQRSLRLSASAAIVTGGVIAIARHHKVPMAGRVWRNQIAENSDDNEEGIVPPEEANEKNDEEIPATSSAMIATIGVYKNFISPLLPPACRFVPTCSQYGVQAIEKYGPGKGVILTTWRLMRCSPFGGKGYDPPKWPPVSYTYSSY